MALKKISLTLMSAVAVFPFALPAPVLATTCVTAANRTTAQAVVTNLRLTGGDATLDSWGLLHVCEETARNRCIPSPTASDEARGVMCCAPNTPGVGVAISCPTITGGASKKTTKTGGSTSGAFSLPSCTSDGNCQLDDIIRTGASFANFLFGLSGAVFLLIFVYAGFLYLIAGESTDVSKAKKMLKDACIGMVLMFGAGTLIRFVQKTISTPVQTESKTGQQLVSACETEYGARGYECVFVSGANQSERKRNRPDCLANKCRLPGQQSMPNMQPLPRRIRKLNQTIEFFF